MDDSYFIFIILCTFLLTFIITLAVFLYVVTRILQNSSNTVAPQAQAVEDWQGAIRGKLITLFQSRPEDLIRILLYLEEEDREFREHGRPATKWQTLKEARNSEDVFKAYAERIITETSDTPVDDAMNHGYAEINENMAREETRVHQH